MKVFGSSSLRLGYILHRVLDKLWLTHFLLGVDCLQSVLRIIVVQNCWLNDKRLLWLNLLHLGRLPQFRLLSLRHELNVLYLKFWDRLVWTFSSIIGCCRTNLVRGPYFPHAIVLGRVVVQILTLFLSDLDFLLHDVKFLGLSVLILCLGYAQIGVPHVERLNKVID